MAKRTRKLTLLDEVMAEHIQLPGAPQVIVTREWAYFWLKKLGYPTDCRQTRFGSVDYMVFGIHRRAVDEPLTDLTTPHIAALITLMESHANG